MNSLREKHGQSSEEICGSDVIKTSPYISCQGDRKGEGRTDLPDLLGFYAMINDSVLYFIIIKWKKIVANRSFF